MTDRKGARYFTLIGLGFLGCTSLTSVDWSLIPAPIAAAGTSASGGTEATAGGPSEGGEPAGGQAGQGGAPAGAAGQGEAGYAGELGGAPPETGGSEAGGTSAGTAGSGGVSGGGVGGVAGGGTGGGGAGGTGGSATTICTDYPTTPLATGFTGKIVLFDGGTKPPNAAWGGRAGIDAACKSAAQTLGLTKKTVHALAVDNTEEAINTLIMGNYAEAFGVPTDLSIVSKFGIVLGQWSDFAQSPSKSFICAGVVHDDVTEWFSGVTASGDVDPLNNCSAWSFGDDSVATRAAVGRTDTTARVFHENWLSDHWVSCASATAHALCLAWGD